MPELIQDSTSPPIAVPPPVPPRVPPIPPEPPEAPILPPVIDPSEWERFPLLRESAMVFISEPTFNAALRSVADRFFSMVLEGYDRWPEWPESSTRMELRAAVADMRHLQGFLASVGQERHLSSLDASDARLSKHAARTARLMKQVADTLERKLAKGVADA